MEQGQTLAVELLAAAEGSEVTFEPLMVVDGDTVLAGAGVAGSVVEARVVGRSKGPKITGFTYKSKTRGRKSWGHRQHYTTIEITGITKGEG